MNNSHLQASSTLSNEKELLTGKSRIELLKLMSKLGILDRDILVMKFIQENTNEEIAINMGLGQHTIEQRINHALKKLPVT